MCVCVGSGLVRVSVYMGGDSVCVYISSLLLV
jgi:hypothetical protein